MKSQVQDSTGKLLAVTGCGRCSTCNTIQPAENFYRDKHRSCGLSSRCKTCDQARLETLPERSLTADLKRLMSRHPAYRDLLTDVAGRLSAA